MPRQATIAALRRQIDRIDDRVLALLSRRARLAQSIGAAKASTHASVYAPAREKGVLERLVRANRGPLAAAHVRAVFREVISASRSLEQPLRVAYLGPPGTFSHAAVAKHFGEFAHAEPATTIDEVFRAAESGQVDYAVVPVENSTEGAVGRTLDLMCQTPLIICGEIKLRVRQNLLANVAAVADVTRVYSHAQSLAQCVQWLAAHLPAVPRVAVASNAEAARLAAAEPGAAAIAGQIAAAIYGLDVLVPHIEDEPNNTTRFWVLGRQQVPPSGKDETSLVMSTPNRPGSLHDLLGPFAKHGVSMSRLESRPARTGLWEYLFFIDLVGHQTDAPVAAAIAELRVKAPFLKLLGSYPAAVY